MPPFIRFLITNVTYVTPKQCRKDIFEGTTQQKSHPILTLDSIAGCLSVCPSVGLNACFPLRQSQVVTVTRDLTFLILKLVQQKLFIVHKYTVAHSLHQSTFFFI